MAKKEEWVAVKVDSIMPAKERQLSTTERTRVNAADVSHVRYGWYVVSLLRWCVEDYLDRRDWDPSFRFLRSHRSCFHIHFRIASTSLVRRSFRRYFRPRFHSLRILLLHRNRHMIRIESTESYNSQLTSYMHLTD
jgi:hypothetical protein